MSTCTRAFYYTHMLFIIKCEYYILCFKTCVTHFQGWGTQFFGGPFSPVLMEVTVPIWNHQDCQASYTNRIYDTVMCAGSYAGGKDSCQVNSQCLHL